MALDFPASPTVGLKYPEPPVAGVPVYSWDGEKWTTYGGLLNPQGPADALPLMDATPAELGTSMEFAREDHVHPTDTTRAAVEAASAGMAYSGMQINGGMEVSQERGATPITNVAGHVCDGWRIGFAGGMGFSAFADNGGGTLFYTPYRLLQSVSTAQVSLGAGDYLQIFQRIEGYRVLRLQWGTANAQPLTIGFWTAHFRTGVYSVVIRNGAASRAYATTYTQAVSNVAQYNVVTIPGDTTGAWNIDNTTGMDLVFTVACGTTFTIPVVNTWTAGNYIAAPGQVNAVAATSDVFRITGVTILPGTQAPTAEQSPNIMRPYDQELVTCQRYYMKGAGRSAGYAMSPGSGILCPLYWSMRAAPTMTFSWTSNANVNVGSSNVSALSAVGGFSFMSATASGNTDGQFTYAADARL